MTIRDARQPVPLGPGTGFLRYGISEPSGAELLSVDTVLVVQALAEGLQAALSVEQISE